MSRIDLTKPLPGPVVATGLSELSAVALRSLRTITAKPTRRQRLTRRWYAFWRRVLLGEWR